MGKISDLIKILKGEGDIVGARRAERVGDEAPYAAERISADTLRRALSGRGDNADTVALIRPADFKWLAEPLPSGYLDEPSTPKLQAPPNTSPREYIRGLQTIAREQGFEDVPFLTYGQHEGTTRLGVTGHEGRHRMRALENLGDEKALVRLLPRASVREPLPRRSRSEFLEALAAKYGDPMYLDPEGVESSAAVDLTKPVQPFQAGGLAKFFSAVDEAVANLRQKKGTGEQMLKQIQQSPGVKKEEIELRRLPEKLAGQQKVTQEDIQAMLKAVPAPKLKMTVRSDKPQKLMQPEIETWIDQFESRRKFVSNLLRHGYAPIQNPEDPGMIGFLSPDGDITDVDELKDLFATELEYAAEAMRDARNAYYGMFANNRGTGAYKEGISRENVDAAQIEYADAKAQHSDIQGQYTALIEFNNDWNVATKFGNPPKFEHFTSKGPKQNYRELEIQLDRPERKQIEMPPFEYNRQGLGGDPEEITVNEAMQRLGLQSPEEVGYKAESVLFYPRGNYIVKRNDGKYYTEVAGDEIMKDDLGEVETWLATQLETELKRPMLEPPLPAPFVQPTHFPEPDIVVHTRVSDRVGPNGEKILYVEEIQSDWHQKARKLKMEAAESIADSEIVGNQIADEARRQVKIELGLDPDAELPLFLPDSTVNVERRFKEKRAELKNQRIAEEMKKLPKDYGYQKMGTRTPPWQQTSHELAVKQLLDTAANEGYDKVVFSPGSEQIERYSLGNYLEQLKVTDTGDAYIIDAVTKDGQPITKGVQTKQELADNIGDDKVALIFEQFAQSDTPGGKKQAVLKGDDLVLGDTKAQGKLKIYDEIIPQYLGKYAGKEFNVQPGRTPIVVEDIEDLRAGYEYEKRNRIRKELAEKFERGDLEEDLDFELREMIDEATRNQARRELFSPSRGSVGSPSAYERFLQRFAPDLAGDDEVSPADLTLRQLRFVEEVDPSSSFGRGTSFVYNIIPEKFKFKDPVKQAEFEEFLEEEYMNTALDSRTRERLLWSRLQEEAEKRILKMTPEELFADMPPPKTIQGASIDITPEMREKITTKGQPLFAVPPAAAGAAALLQEEEPVQEYKEAGRVEKKKGMQQEQFDPPFDESRRMGPKVGVSSGPAKIRDLAKILRGENSEQQNLSRQRIAGNVEAGRGLGEYMYDMMVPQTGWEWAAEAAFFPVPRPVRKGLLAAAGAMYDPEAEAGKLTLLHGSPSKIKSLQEGKDLWATTDPEYALKRAMDKMRIAEGAKGPGYLNQFQIEDTDLMRLADKYSPEDIAIARRAFSKLPEGREMTGEEIYEVASTNTGGAKTAALEGVTRALGKKGYQVPSGADDKGDWYRVLEQTDLEMQRYKGGKVKKSR